MPTTFLDASGNYYETLTDRPTPDGHTAVPKRPQPWSEWVDGAWVTGDEPAPDASSIELTNLQFALAAVGASLMTEQEAEDWVATGALPASATTALATLPDDGTRAAARIRFRGARVIARTDPFIAVLQSALSLTDEQVDNLFLAGADL